MGSPGYGFGSKPHRPATSDYKTVYILSLIIAVMSVIGFGFIFIRTMDTIRTANVDLDDFSTNDYGLRVRTLDGSTVTISGNYENGTASELQVTRDGELIVSSGSSTMYRYNGPGDGPADDNTTTSWSPVVGTTFLDALSAFNTYEIPPEDDADVITYIVNIYDAATADFLTDTPVLQFAASPQDHIHFTWPRPVVFTNGISIVTTTDVIQNNSTAYSPDKEVSVSIAIH